MSKGTTVRLAVVKQGAQLGGEIRLRARRDDEASLGSLSGHEAAWSCGQTVTYAAINAGPTAI